MKTNEKDTKLRIVPALRFPEFSEAGAWAIITLNKLASRIIKKNNGHICRVLTNSAADGVVDQTDYFDRNIVSEKNLHNYYVIENGDYVYNPRISTSAPVGPISKNYIGQGVMSPLYTIFRFHNDHNEFHNQYFKTKYWHKYLKNIANQGARFDRMNITTDDFMNMPIPAPCQKEQQKIADCLSSIDALIKAAENKIDELKAHKKGLMQQLFPAEGKTVPALRFPEFQNAGEWKPYKLNDFGSFFRGLTYSTTDASNDNDGIGVLRSTNIQNNRLILDKDLVFVNKTCTSEQRLQKGDVVICMSNGSKALVGKNAELDQDISYNLTVGAFCSIFRPKNVFAKYLLQTDSYTKFVALAIGGGNINNLKNSDLENFVQFAPVKPVEQQKIADCLSSVDDLITIQTNRLEALKAHKKGLMQQLFPNIE